MLHTGESGTHGPFPATAIHKDAAVKFLAQSRTARPVRKDHPERLVEEAVRGMLPKTKLGRAMFHKLKVYAGPKHPHQAQKPEPLTP